jgi:predicted dienelactone hydrolase
MRLPRVVGWSLCLTLVLAGRAGAQDACLTGASTLGDQRAIAAWRTNVETSCPCAAATSRGSYRRCAKAVLTVALGAATLRAECEQHAKRILKGAACGSDRVPCGRERAGADEPISCKPKRASACVDTARLEQTPCTAHTHCADVVEWTAGTCSDVRVRGPFEAGVMQLTLTKPSAVDPLQPRVLDTYVWYPTTAGAGPIDPATGGVVDAPLDASGGPYPIVLFSHGSCGYALQSTFLLPLIAARGYVVVAPPHPGNTLFDGLAVCGAPTSLASSFVERPQDMMFVLDEMLAANADGGSPFFGTLDPTRIAMTGHSFGGLTTYLVVGQDPRITVAVPMAPATAAGLAPLTIPSLLMQGEIDGRVDNVTATALYDAASPPKARVEILDAGHYAFSNGCFPSPDCAPPATLDQNEAHAAVLRWVLPFLEWRLGGNDGFAAFFEAPQPPGVVVERVD